MRLLVTSDSHGREGLLRDILRREMASSAPPDYFLFLGDGLSEFEALSYDSTFLCLPSLAVRGNCDMFLSEDTPELRELTLAGWHIMMMHGHRFDVKRGTAVASAFARSKKQDLLLYGHTHIPREERTEAENVGGPLVTFNPGSVRDGRYGVVTLLPDGIFCELKSI